MTMPRPDGRIALVKLSALGDIVHTLPVASALRASWPAAHITWIVERRHAGILRDHPALNEIIVVDTQSWRRARGPRALRSAGREVMALRRRLRAGRFDVAFDLQGLIKSGLFALATGARTRIGFARGECHEWPSTLLTNHHVTLPTSARHVVEQYLALLHPLGTRANGKPVEFHLPSDPDAEMAVDEFFAASGVKPRDRVVVLNPGAGRPEKRWPAAQFAELGRRLVADDAAHAIVAWGPGEVALAHAIADGGGALVAPPTNLDRLVALLRRASVVVAADTGPLHIAAALGVPCVGLYGPTPAVRNAPYGKGHRTLQGRDGTMTAIETESVLRAVRELLP
jgi:lipopolysaccharide heptosyltransferase I